MKLILADETPKAACVAPVFENRCEFGVKVLFEDNLRRVHVHLLQSCILHSLKQS